VDVDIETLVTRSEVFDVRRLGPQVLALPDLEIDTVPAGAVVLDLRSAVAYSAWHYPGALHLELSAALRAVDSFATDKTYVVYCEIGLKSAHLAYRMREAGLEAYNFHGGLKSLVHYAHHARPAGAGAPT
jgi:thiamine biosynthesis protein ThiI